ncbi:GcrA family cell cycle regulator [Bradyrhizobium sp. UNPA324]|uniref:GcrA family cell cycle regulator n=1 Tax=Bradyrhizobium sp. UNPA324 TaxID=1141174 RepID=UPI001FEF55EA|nr:GcrA family cell cycle regulator [Bradyrhizobium sp. UNPA324]
MSWDERDLALLKELWALGHSAAQIARALGCSRNAVCGRLTRLHLKRGHKPPAAKPRIRLVPTAGVVGRLCRPDGKGGIETAREAAA